MADKTKQMLVIKDKKKMNRIKARINKYCDNTNNLKRNERRKDQIFFEHDTRNDNNNLRGNVRSTVNVINETQWNNAQLEMPNFRKPPRIRKNAYRLDKAMKPNNFGNVNKLRKQLLKQQQKVQKQLQALQAQKSIASLLSPCCCKCNLLSNKDGVLSGYNSKPLEWLDVHSHWQKSSNSLCSIRNVQNTFRYEGLQLNCG